MIKKSFIHIFIFILISQCGFSPMYSQNSNFNENIFINSMEFKGDEEINKYLKIYLSKYNKEKNENGFDIQANTNYNKQIISKDKTAKITNYKLSSDNTFKILYRGEVIKEIFINEQNNMENMNDKFEAQKYENDVKQNFASSISNKLLLELALLNDN